MKHEEEHSSVRSGVSPRRTAREVKPVIGEAGAAERYAALIGPGSAAPSIPVVSLWPATLVIREAPSGEVYRWASGQTVMVKPEDVEYLRGFNHGGKTGCCGGGARTYFQFPNGG